MYDVTIIGTGPAGLYASFYSGLRGMKTKLIDSQAVLGGKIHAYPEKMIWDVGGMPPLLGEQLITRLSEQAILFDPTVVLNSKVEGISQQDGGFLLSTETGETHTSKTVILATGSGILTPKKIGLAGEEKFIQTNLHYTVKSLARFKDKVVLISGGGNSAVDWANTLEPIAKKVYVTYRKDHLTGHEAEIEKLLNSSVEVIYQSVITGLNGTDYIESVTLNGTEQLPVEEVIINHGYDSQNDLQEQSEVDIKMHPEFGIQGTSMAETSVPGIFAAGDAVNYDGKVHLIAGAFHDAANAVNRAKQFIEPTALKTAMVSSHHESFKNKNKKIYAELEL
ncbi:ferredoxin--NADP reductase [Oceanobacillus picturae]|uniref:Ferredoxin--NADP reductase n=1 Tax=Oceanobacillus picturae TaxID=171693 RepID=A0A0U9HD93_9BACI|nr:NAD(P)/FAD-dependent oxidoreductase [Oceanobacillus picturae]GAQ18168.1 ferredoxin--NADP reductase [Oceanobacillus picturae]